MEMTIKELLKEYKMELDLKEKLKYNDYEGIGETFMLRGMLLSDINSLTKEEYDEILIYEKEIQEVYDELLAKYPQLKRVIEEGRSKMIEYQLKSVA